MRTLTVSLLAGLSALGVTAAKAADLDYGVLRGPDYETAAPEIDWSGVYVGGQSGYTTTSLGFKNVFQELVARQLNSTIAEAELGASTLLIPRSVRVEGGSFGGYAGYNIQFDDTVIGVEGDYTHFGKVGSGSDSVARVRTTSDGFLTTAALSGVSSTKIQEFGTIRARAGYAMGNFLPFITGGLAIGKAQVTDSVAINTYGYDQAAYKANVAIVPATPPTPTQTPQFVNNYGYSSFDQNNPNNSTVAPATVIRRSSMKTVGGLSLGAGIEYAITSNFILRGEYQYVLFNDFDGHKVNVNTLRGGAAVKF